jgi:rod shape-determining protein MreC
MLQRRRTRFSGDDIRYGMLMCFLAGVLGVSVKSPELNDRFSSAVVSVMTPFVGIVQQPNVAWTRAVDYLERHLDVVEKNSFLEQRQQHLLMLEHEVQVLARENAKLRDALNMVKPVDGAPLASYVVADTANTFSQSVLVNSGAFDGVEKGQEVLSAKGVVGRVVNVYENTSRVLLLTDYASRIPVKFLNANVQGIVRGGNGHQLELLFLEHGVDVSVGDKVITSGVGGVFTQGLLVGAVSSNASGRIMIDPAVNFSNLELVTIPRRSVKGVLDDVNTH